MSFQLWKNRNFRNPHPASYTVKLKPENVMTLHGTNKLLYFHSSLMKRTKTICYPKMGNLTSCGAMLLTNLADPEWITIGCNEAVTIDTMCFFGKTKTSLTDSPLRVSTKVHGKSCIHKNATYHIFHLSDPTGHKSKHKRKIILNIRIFEFLFNAVGVLFSPIELYPSSLVMKYEKLGSQYRYHTSFIDKQINYKYPGRIQVFLQDHSSWEPGGNIFKCNHTFWSICFQHDCFHHLNTKRAGSTCFEISQKDLGLDLAGNDNNSVCCVDWCVKERNNKCGPVDWDLPLRLQDQHSADVQGVHKTTGSSHLLCNDGSTMCVEQGNIQKRGHGSGTQEATLVAAVVIAHVHFCSQNSQLPCREDIGVCYNISNICSYQFSECNKLLHCEGGEHLENCQEFECNMMFKCPNFYCIPWAYVCDMKWDCPKGLDDSHKYVKACTNAKNLTDAFT